MEELDELWRAYLARPSLETRNRLVERYAPLVWRVAGRLQLAFGRGHELEDLVGYGAIGLIEAIERFDPTRGIRFETYAAARIRGAILDGLRAYDQVPTSWRRHARALEQAFSRLELELGREPELAEVAAALGWTEEQVEERLGDVGRIALLSLDQTLFDGRVLADEVADERAASPGEELAWSEAKALLTAALDRLSDKERTVIALFYDQGLTLREIAAVMNLTPSRISQLHHRAILRLRGMLARSKAIFF